MDIEKNDLLFDVKALECFENGLASILVINEELLEYIFQSISKPHIYKIHDSKTIYDDNFEKTQYFIEKSKDLHKTKLIYSKNINSNQNYAQAIQKNEDKNNLLTIVATGMVGVGKSTILNELLDSKSFMVGGSEYAEGCTKEITSDVGYFNGTIIKAFDFPGFGDRRKTLTSSFLDFYLNLEKKNIFFTFSIKGRSS